MTTLPQFTSPDLHVAACTLYGEARGEPREGQIAVAWIIRNRSQRRAFAGSIAGLPGSITRVCRMAWQFSCWNADDPNRPALDRLLESMNAGENLSGPMLAIAKDVMMGCVADPTGGADHYHTIQKPVWAGQWPPDWAPTMVETARFGGHVFYNSLMRR